MGPHPAVAEVRRAVRGGLAGMPGLGPGELVLAACSGGADSLALAAALAFEAPKIGLRAGGITIDHGLQVGSAERASELTKVLAGMGLDPVRSVAVAVARRPAAPGDPAAREAAYPGPEAARREAAYPGPEAAAREAAYPGPEAAAREARYAALSRTAGELGAAAIMLGHTLDDQAETVLLGLARGSGARSLAGMAVRHGRYLRPLLGVRRATTRAACAALGLQPWDDPHNTDPRYTRARVRGRLLPVLEEHLGPGVAEALARSAAQLQADTDVLDELAAQQAQRLTGVDRSLPADALARLPAAIRTRVLKSAAIAAGCPAGDLSARHVAALDALVVSWRGQRWADLPGGVRCRRRYGRLLFSARA
jgi:tRNA(Ile)-lysidine synthase